MEIINQEKNRNYLMIIEKDIPNNFEIVNELVYLKNSRALPIKIKFPIILNEELARIPAMIMDGTISKELKSCGFYQKKDTSKVTEFNKIITNLFSICGIVSINKSSGVHGVSFSRKTLASFLHLCLDIHKSDESARIPYWIWNSPLSVVKEYLRYAFAMEGSIKPYSNGYEIKFHSVDLPYLKELKKILSEKFGIKSIIQPYYIKNYGWKYFLYISYIEGIKKFQEIGFALDSHQKRLDESISNIKSKSWEITLVKILELNKKHFSLGELRIKFPKLCKRTVHYRLTILVNKKYLKKERIGYLLTEKAYNQAILLNNSINTLNLRTHPKENEAKVIELLTIKGENYRNCISRELNINSCTIRDTLRRLVNNGKIEHVRTDKFGKKFFKIKT